MLSLVCVYPTVGPIHESAGRLIVSEAELPVRKHIRLKYFDYSSAGAYFVTFCVKNNECLLGEVAAFKTVLNKNGLILKQTTEKIVDRFPGVQIDELVIMPNHVHMILLIDSEGAKDIPLTKYERRKMLVPLILGYIKTNSAKEINLLREMTGEPVWQKNYYEHVIKNEEAYLELKKYIRDNPLQWELRGVITKNNK